MRYNSHNPTMFGPISGHGDLAMRLTAIRQAEREHGARYPLTTEALLLQWETQQQEKRDDGR